MQGLFFASPLLSSLLLLVVPTVSRSSHLFTFSDTFCSRVSGVRISLSLSFSFSSSSLSPLLSFSVARARARTRETPRCISSIFKRHGLSVPRGSASIYKASGRLLLSAAFFSRANYVGLANLEKRQYRPYTRESVVESIPCRRAAFYLRPPYAFSFRLTLVLYPFPPSLPSIILHRSSRVFATLRRVFALASFLLRYPPPSAALPLSIAVTAGGCSLICRYL